MKTLAAVRPAYAARSRCWRIGRDVVVSLAFFGGTWALAAHGIVGGPPTMPSSSFDSPGLGVFLIPVVR